MADDPELKETMRQKYGSLAVQLDPKVCFSASGLPCTTVRTLLCAQSFEERWRHVFALEAMSLAVENLMYWEGFVLATKPMQPG